MAVRPAGRWPTPKRPTPERVRRLNALADLHDRLVAAQVDSAGFDPTAHPKKGSDYNQHNVDLDGDPAALDAFHAAAMKLLKGGAGKG